MNDPWDARDTVGLIIGGFWGFAIAFVLAWWYGLRRAERIAAFDRAHLTVAEKLEPKSTRRRPSPPMGQHVNAATDADAAEQIARGLWR